MVTDTEGQQGFQQIVVRASDVDEPADLADGQQFELLESTEVGTTFGTVQGVFDGGDTFSIVGGDGTFDIDSTTAELTLIRGLDFEGQQSHDVTVRATSGSNVDETIVRVDVVNTYEADLSVTKTNGRSFVREGETVVYTITIDNTGDSDAVGAAVHDPFTGLSDLLLLDVSTTVGTGLALGDYDAVAIFQEDEEVSHGRRLDVDYLDVGVDLGQTLGGTSSLSFWIHTRQSGDDVAPQSPTVTGYDDRVARSNAISVDGQDIYWGWINRNGQISLSARGAAASSSTAINDGKWHHVVLTRRSDDGAVRVFVDGVPEGTGHSNPGVLDASFSLLGRVGEEAAPPFEGPFDIYDGPAPGFDGALRDVRVFDTSLDDADVAQLHRDGNTTVSAAYQWFGTSSGGGGVLTSRTAGEALPGGLNDVVNLPVGASITYTIQGVVAAAAAPDALLGSGVMVTADWPNRTPGGHGASDGDIVAPAAAGGSGQFISGQDLGSGGLAIELGDVDADGDLDTVLATSIDTRVYLNDGDGQFSLALQLPHAAQSLDLGDLDGDTDLDLYLGTDTVDRVYLNQGGVQGGLPGEFVSTGQAIDPFHEFSLDAPTIEVHLADADDDGDLDAVLQSTGDGSLGTTIWLNGGKGLFANVPQLASQSRRLSVNPSGLALRLGAVADYDGNETIDVFSAARDRYQWYANQSFGQFQLASGSTVGSAGQPYEAADAGDIDGDNFWEKAIRFTFCGVMAPKLSLTTTSWSMVRWAQPSPPRTSTQPAASLT